MSVGLDNSDETSNFAGIDAVGGKVDPNLAMAAQSGHIGMRHKEEEERKKKEIDRLIEKMIAGCQFDNNAISPCFTSNMNSALEHDQFIYDRDSGIWVNRDHFVIDEEYGLHRARPENDQLH